MKKTTKTLTFCVVFAIILLFPIVTVYAGQVFLKQGMSGDNVLMLQKQLQKYGYYKGSLDRKFGPNTYNAVIKFQSDHNLKVDGIVGLETSRALDNYKSTYIPPSRGLMGEQKSQSIVSFAMKFLNTPYVWSGNKPSGFDCSGFTYYVFSQHGINLPRIADEQFKAGIQVSQPQLGDLVFFTTYKPGPSHVGIYIGNNQFIHSSSARGYVTITSLSKPYYKARYLGGRNVIR